MAEQQIANLGQRAAPLTRVTKDSEEFELLAVNGNFDGTSAASAFLPCVEVVSDAGLVVARSVGTEEVAAGDSVEVTFAPFLGRSGGGGGGGGASATALYANFTQTIPGGGGFPAGLISWSLSSGTALLDLVTNGPDTPTIITAGVYALSVTVSPSGTADPVGNYISQINLDCNTAVTSTMSNQAPARNNPAFTDVVGVANTQAFAAGDTLDAWIVNTFTLVGDYGCQMVVQQVP